MLKVETVSITSCEFRAVWEYDTFLVKQGNTWFYTFVCPKARKSQISCHVDGNVGGDVGRDVEQTVIPMMVGKTSVPEI